MLALLTEGDLISRLVAQALLLMSVASWVIILWKASLLWRARRDMGRSRAAFWQARSLEEAKAQLQAFDRIQIMLPLLQVAVDPQPGTLASRGQARPQLTRLLRDALAGVLHRLHYGQIVLASVGSTAPFVGLLGTVWGIYHALSALGVGGPASIDQVAGPVGEALIMTAAGLAVAIPAVLGYNVLGRQIQQIEAELEGFAHDLCELLLGAAGSDRA